MRHFLLAIAACSLGGCYPDYVEPSPYYGGGGYVSASIRTSTNSGASQAIALTSIGLSLNAPQSAPHGATCRRV